MSLSAVVGRELAGEEGVAASGRDLDAVEDRAEVGLGEERHVGVPAAAEVHPVVGLGDDVDDLGVLGVGLDVGVRPEIAEAATERDLRRRREVLVAEEEDLVLAERVAQVGDRAVVEVGRQVEAADLGAQDAAHREHVERRHGSTLGPPLRTAGSVGRDGVDLPRPDRARPALRDRRARRQPSSGSALDRRTVGTAPHAADRTSSSAAGGRRHDRAGGAAGRRRSAGGHHRAALAARADVAGPARRWPAPSPGCAGGGGSPRRRGTSSRRALLLADVGVGVTTEPARRPAHRGQGQGADRARAAPRRPARRDEGPAGRRRPDAALRGRRRRQPERVAVRRRQRRRQDDHHRQGRQPAEGRGSLGAARGRRHVPRRRRRAARHVGRAGRRRARARQRGRRSARRRVRRRRSGHRRARSTSCWPTRPGGCTPRPT